MTVTSAQWDALLQAAEAARDRAYAPYSRFHVGAAVLCDDGGVHAGCNVENASYGLTLCAERSAVSRAITDGCRRILAVAVATNAEKATPPCGMCRQVLTEFAAPQTPIRMRTRSGDARELSLGELLPHAFDKSFL